MKPKFNNRPNTEHSLDGKTIWNSRSVAVVGVIISRVNSKLYVLMEKRSSIMDHPGKWCLPCGYIDWDETGWEAVIREIYEETGLYMFDHKSFSSLSGMQPFFVNTDPKENRQNISLSYGFVCPNLTIPVHSNPEVDEVRLIDVLDLDKYDIAFDHAERVRMFIDKTPYL